LRAPQHQQQQLAWCGLPAAGVLMLLVVDEEP
jgi:hypothetical protein